MITKKSLNSSGNGSKSRFSIIGIVVALVATGGLAGCLGGDGGGGGSNTAHIYGIEPGAGMSVTATRHLENDLYGLASAGWEYTASTEAAMLQTYSRAVENGDFVVITAWSPHFMFAKWQGDNQLVYLEEEGDPNQDGQTFYAEESEETRVATLVSKNIMENHPPARTFLENFQMTDEDESALMLRVNEGESTKDVAIDYVDNNPDKVAEWLEGVNADEASGTITLAVPNWAGEEIRSYMVEKILAEELGYDVVVNNNVEVGAAYQSVAANNADVFVGAWLPIQREQYDKTKDDLTDLADNLAGEDVTFGLAVPKYVYDSGITTVQDLVDNVDKFE